MQTLNIFKVTAFLCGSGPFFYDVVNEIQVPLSQLSTMLGLYIFTFTPTRGGGLHGSKYLVGKNMASHN